MTSSCIGGTLNEVFRNQPKMLVFVGSHLISGKLSFNIYFCSITLKSWRFIWNVYITHTALKLFCGGCNQVACNYAETSALVDQQTWSGILSPLADTDFVWNSSHSLMDNESPCSEISDEGPWASMLFAHQQWQFPTPLRHPSPCCAHPC